MENNQILHADYLDILFDNRNKNYGSYTLRKGYGKRAFTAIGIVLGLIAVALIIQATVNYYSPGKKVKPGIKPDPFAEVHLSNEIIVPETKPALRKPEINIPEKAAATPVAATQHFTEPKIVPPDLVKSGDVPHDIDEMKDKLVGPVNNKGQLNGTAIALSKEITKVAGEGEDVHSRNKIAVPSPTTVTPVKNPDEWPEYPGGKKALQEYLSRNIRYPAMAAEAGIEGQVVVSFVVNETGEIADIKLIRKVGGGCDEEALRVIGAMPKWKPGKKGGRAVKVYYLLPVSFKLRN